MDRQYIGRYRLVGRLGTGGMGTVLRAVDEVRQREVAIKLPNEAEPDTISRLQRECEVLAQLQHRNIVQVYGSGSDPDLPFYIVMEYIEGVTVENLLRQQQGPLETRRALKIALGVAEALAHAHKPPLRVIHRDIKPGNILIRTSDQMVKVTDFGIAAVLSERAGRTAVGTMAYMAPEQAMGRGVDERSDLYSLGALLYEMLTHQRPPQLASARAPAPSTFVVDQMLPSDLVARIDQLTLGLLEADPARRVPQNAADVAEEIHAVLEGRPSRLLRSSQAIFGAPSYEPRRHTTRPRSSTSVVPEGTARRAGPPPVYTAYPAEVPQPPMSYPVPPSPLIAQPPVASVVPVMPVVVWPTTSDKAITSLVLGIVGMVLSCVGIGLVLDLLAVIFGHLALGEIRRSNGQLTGSGMAAAGLVMGYGCLAIAVLVIWALIAHG